MRDLYCLVSDAFDLIEGNRIIAPVVETSCTCRFVAGHLLGDLKFAPVLQVGGDAGRAKAVARNFGGNASFQSAALDHRINIRLGERVAAGEFAMPQGREEGRAGLRRKSGETQPLI